MGIQIDLKLCLYKSKRIKRSTNDCRRTTKGQRSLQVTRCLGEQNTSLEMISNDFARSDITCTEIGEQAESSREKERV